MQTPRKISLDAGAMQPLVYPGFCSRCNSGPRVHPDGGSGLRQASWESRLTWTGCRCAGWRWECRIVRLKSARLYCGVRACTGDLRTNSQNLFACVSAEQFFHAAIGALSSVIPFDSASSKHSRFHLERPLSRAPLSCIPFDFHSKTDFCTSHPV